MTHEELKTVVREAMKEILAELKPMPVPASPTPVTEIIIRTGVPEAMQVLGGVVPLCPCPICPETAMPIGDKSKELLQKIQKKTGEAPEDLVRKLDRKVRAQKLAEEIEKFAEEVGVEQQE